MWDLFQFQEWRDPSTRPCKRRRFLSSFPPPLGSLHAALPHFGSPTGPKKKFSSFWVGEFSNVWVSISTGSRVRSGKEKIRKQKLPVAWKMTSLTVFHNPLPPPLLFSFPFFTITMTKSVGERNKLNKNILITWVTIKIRLSWFFWNTFFQLKRLKLSDTQFTLTCTSPIIRRGKCTRKRQIRLTLNAIKLAWENKIILIYNKTY